MIYVDPWKAAAERAELGERRPGMTPLRRGLAELFVDPLTAIIGGRLDDKARLPHARLGVLLQTLEPRALAVMALEAVVPQIGRPRRRKVAYEFERDLKEAIGQVFYANVTMAKAVEDAHGDGQAIDRLRWQKLALRGELRVKRHETPGQWLGRLRRERGIIWWALTKDVERDETLRAGSWLLHCVMEAGIVRMVGNNLLPADEWQKEIKRLQQVILRANVRLLPLAEKPAHWTKPTIYRGGLRVNFLPHWNRAHQNSIATSFNTSRFHRLHLAATNTLGDTPLCIDAWTLELVSRCAVEVCNHKDADRRHAYAQQLERDVGTAATLLRRGVFYNSYHIDFRGRQYSDQVFNYARGDEVRSLFRFAHGADIGGRGLRWLMINVANTAGLDKLSYTDRIKWVNVNYDTIERIAKNPHDTLDAWREVANPFAFASACRELMLAANDTKRLSNLPIASDHSASGIQHLSLAGLDAAAASLVNLVDGEAPRDVYAELAARTLELFDASPWADFWRERLGQLDPAKTRKLFKPLGSTFAYAATERGNVRQLLDAYYEIFKSELSNELGAETIKAALYLVNKFRPACAEMLPGPVKTMKYIQSLVRETNAAGRFLEWDTFSGLRVANIYPKLRTAVVYLPDGVRNTLAVGAIPDTVDKSKTISAAAANYTHSLDSTHLARTVVALAENEMPVLCVHDAYAVLAAHVEQLHIANREELVLMYNEMFERGGPLELLRQQNGGVGEPPPAPGTYSLMQAQSSTYVLS
jgi:DNA-dependent RNA polymerase